MRTFWMLVLLVGCDDRKEKIAESRAKLERTLAADKEPAPAPAPVVVAIDAAPVQGPTFADGVKVTPNQLYADYSSNEVSADDKYKGKLLAVTGIIRKISKDFDDKPVVQLAAGQFSEVYAYPEANSDESIAELKKGMKVEILCRGAGVSLDTPILKPCRIEHTYVRQ